MTVIEPNKYRFRINATILAAVLLFLVGAFLSIVLYNQNVRLYHGLKASQKELEQLRVGNVELKNQLYNLLEFGDAEAFAERLGLVKEKRPDYLAHR